MKHLNFEAFLGDFGKLTRHRMNMSMYTGSFECACGESHWFDEHRIDIIGDGFWKVLVVCPRTGRHVTSLKIKTTFGFGFKGYESLAGAELSTEEEMVMLQTLRRLAEHA
ncbi:hypothetical protein LV780_18050 [Cereibacter azotoformans]|uniref:hypothetical protein n=1 Tax=Cereibacter azotoformans TaxID=43057 RepID=UPI000E3601E2|nr:hypothetical protein [Cereibacter azotoformans]AXQ95516.1 hypothetical protein D0Z66_17215 [Cereibacter sphaeroides]UIJ32240.1 hypothetical protein LV780_18050 [Cereibacter azotoformans]